MLRKLNSIDLGQLSRTKENMQSDPDPPWISDAFKNVPNIRSMAKHPFMQGSGTNVWYEYSISQL